jgi:hypothetical protein
MGLRCIMARLPRLSFWQNTLEALLLPGKAMPPAGRTFACISAFGDKKAKSVLTADTDPVLSGGWHRRKSGDSRYGSPPRRKSPHGPWGHDSRLQARARFFTANNGSNHRGVESEIRGYCIPIIPTSPRARLLNW